MMMMMNMMNMKNMKNMKSMKDMKKEHDDGGDDDDDEIEDDDDQYDDNDNGEQTMMMMMIRPFSILFTYFALHFHLIIFSIPFMKTTGDGVTLRTHMTLRAHIPRVVLPALS